MGRKASQESYNQLKIKYDRLKRVIKIIEGYRIHGFYDMEAVIDLIFRKELSLMEEKERNELRDKIVLGIVYIMAEKIGMKAEQKIKTVAQQNLNLAST